MKTKIEQITELLFNMVFSLKFLGAVVAIIYMYLSRDLVSMATIAIAYVGIKSVIDASIAWKNNGEYEFEFTTNQKANSIICWIVSTRTWIALLGAGLCYRAMLFGIVTPEVGIEQIRNVGIAYGGALGFPEVAGFLKGASLDFLKPKPKPTVTPTPASSPDIVPNGQGSHFTPAPVPISQPVPEKTFSEADKFLLLELATVGARASVTTTSQIEGVIAGEYDKEDIFFHMQRYALDTIQFPADNINRVRDGLSYILQYGKQAYFEKAKHSYGEAGKHLADTNPTCPYTSVNQYARAEGFEKLMLDVADYEEMLLKVEWAMGRGYDLISQAPYAYQSIGGMGLFAGDVYRQAQVAKSPQKG